MYFCYKITRVANANEKRKNIYKRVAILGWSLNSKNEMPNLNQTFSNVVGYKKGIKVFGGDLRPPES